MKLGYLNLMIWWILLHQSCRLFSLHRGRKTGGLLFHFILSKIVAFGTALLFRVFQASRGKREAGVEGELRASRAPPLTRACLRSLEKRQKTTTITTTTTTCKIRRNGRKLEKTTKSVAWRWEGDGWYKLCLFT